MSIQIQKSVLKSLTRIRHILLIIKKVFMLDIDTMKQESFTSIQHVKGKD